MQVHTGYASTLQHPQQQQSDTGMLHGDANIGAEISHQGNHIRRSSPSLISKVADDGWHDPGHDHVRSDRKVDLRNGGAKITCDECDDGVVYEAAERGEPAGEGDEGNDIDFFPLPENRIYLFFVGGEIGRHFILVWGCLTGWSSHNRFFDGVMAHCVILRTRINPR